MAEETKKIGLKPQTARSSRSDYHVTTSQHARQAEDDNDCEVEGGRGRSRSSKAARPAKKATNTLNRKADRAEARAARAW